MGALRVLLLLVPSLYCTSVLVMLFYLPSLQQRISLISHLETASPHSPPIHDHVLVARMAEKRCQNLSRELHGPDGDILRFMTIPGTQTSLLAAYHDDRLLGKSFIRLLVLMKGRGGSPLHCHLPLSPQRMLSVPAILYQFNENHNMPFGGFIASCPLPHVSQEMPLCMVRVTAGPGHRRPGVDLLLERVPRPPQFNLTVCVPPMFGDIPAAHLVEFIELNRLLGFEHFFFYDMQNRSGSTLAPVLEHYARRNLLTLRRWQLPVADNAVWYKGQMLAIHHCLYANMGRARFTAFQDLDEVFVPRRHTSIPNLLSEVDADQHHCGFRIYSAFFPPPRDGQRLFWVRSSRSQVSRLRTKCIVHPELIFEMGIHHISKQNVEEKTPLNLREELVMLHHNRICDSTFGMNCRTFTNDETLVRRIGQTLKKRLDLTFKEILQSQRATKREAVVSEKIARS